AIATLYANIKQKLQQLYPGYADHSIRFDDGTSPEPSLNLTWVLGPPPIDEDVGQLAQFPSFIREALTSIIAEFSKKNSSDLNASQFAFEVAQALSKLDHTPQRLRAGTIYVSHMFGPLAIDKTNISMTELTT